VNLAEVIFTSKQQPPPPPPPPLRITGPPFPIPSPQKKPPRPTGRLQLVWSLARAKLGWLAGDQVSGLPRHTRFIGPAADALREMPHRKESISTLNLNYEYQRDSELFKINNPNKVPNLI